jgi:hypothetical protein
MPAGVIEARRDKPLHAQLAHIAQRHRRAGWVFGVQFDDFRSASKLFLASQRRGSAGKDSDSWHFFTSAALRNDRRFARAALYSS